MRARSADVNEEDVEKLLTLLVSHIDGKDKTIILCVQAKVLPKVEKCNSNKMVGAISVTFWVIGSVYLLQVEQLHERKDAKLFKMLDKIIDCKTSIKTVQQTQVLQSRSFRSLVIIL